MKKIILPLIFILCQAAALGAVSLDIDVSGGLDFDYVIIPNRGSNSNTSVIPANSSGVRVSFVSSEPGDTVSVSFSGANVSGNGLLLDNENINIDFTSSTGEWTGIPTDTPFYIGGTMDIKSRATRNSLLNESITITVTSESIN